MATDPLHRSDAHYAALEDYVDRLREALSKGADVSARDDDGFTPLHLAAQQGAVGATALLLDHGAEVDAVNKHGNTPLFTAVFNSRGEGTIIGLLREHGADAFKANVHGQTPVGLARLISNYAVADFFSDLPDRA
jgi:ankyrin repeat protein